jgi:5'-3' exonuclease
MNQPVRQNVSQYYTQQKENSYILLVDGSSVLKLSMVNKNLNSNGTETIGHIVNFLWVIRKMLVKRTFAHVYVFWDGDMSGILRYNLYNDYKMNRHKQYSSYDMEINAFVKTVLNKGKTEKEIEAELLQKEYVRARYILYEIIEDLFIRQVIDQEGGTEADDLIAYYCINKKPNEKIYIVTLDSDLSQLIDDDVAIYNIRKKQFYHKGNFQEIFGMPIENFLLTKIMCGDLSDNIKGIKGLGITTLKKCFPDFEKKPVTIEELIEEATLINSQRKKPLKVLENIIERVTDGVQGKDIFEINEKIVNLKKPILSKEAKMEMDDLMDSPISIDDRSMQNVAKIVEEHGIADFMGNKFSGFFKPFMELANREKMFFKNFTNVTI